jgi:lipopolysaccharide biosynthesis glycosyltransferase
MIVSKDIYDEQKEIINKICKEHINCNISFLLLTKEFKEFTPIGIINRTTAIFYRLILQNLLPNEKKILYFDCDTLIYKDLSEIYNLNITDKYYIGQFESKPLEKYGKNLSNFINSGVMLINLENLRKDNIFKKIYQFLRDNNRTLFFLDQDAINVVCNKKIGFFPSYFVSSGICDLNSLKNINRKNKFYNNTNKYLIEPYIFHFKIYTKPWFGIAINKNKMICFDFFPRFYEYARKTNFYFEILEQFRVYQ